ncbi:hypothetical protein LAC1533_0343 [Ligilactobacillus acidipiscis]|uniref:Uncharacterized protein n=1 Tax=Ligilactobacillus acidipiscis TaxID=89059 RepID=A0A1K1KQR0_9LACO|nr:hypothetical protein LAC1533_0343 [Ligilactobacillus acidipiscis]
MQRIALSQLVKWSFSLHIPPLPEFWYTLFVIRVTQVTRCRGGFFIFSLQKMRLMQLQPL